MTLTIRRCMAVLAAAVLVAATLVVGNSVHAQSTTPVRVMPLGDSITDGFNVPGGYRIGLWQNFLSGGQNVDFVGSQSNGPASLGDRDHQGHSGWRIDQLDANINNWIRTYTPRTVLLHIGTNDITQNRDLPNAPNRLAGLIDKILAIAPNTYIFVATIIPAGFSDAQIRSYNAAIPQIVQSRANAGRNVFLVDMYAALTTADLADGVHPNATGYGKMATAWYNALVRTPGSLLGGGGNPAPTSTPGPTVTPSPTGTPNTSPSPTTPPPVTTPPPGGGGCTAAVTLNQWNGGFVATVRVTAGSAGTNSWTVGMTLPGGATVTNAWNADRSGNSGAVQFRNVSYNGRIAAGQSTEFGFQGTGSGSGIAPSCTAG
ncbi:GDSL-type esterase/lipase family protein [Micromonospora sp. NBC_01813]|uniref:GDSL-type esterase/lipase family protein n=1 Tax=Micromonospora sp. NBC_01813 TaxID=2975988 RepID=UPI002DD9C040|nr:GDSL-type esterase/lipase family protein [Micromonospora sp. NBC_01813]WSA08724.1 GDSL-type esterase/lipase family protein [Micromonospora sp. NBC_01813]